MIYSDKRSFNKWLSEDAWTCKYNLHHRTVLWRIMNKASIHTRPEFVPDWNRFLKHAYIWWEGGKGSDPLAKRAEFAAKIKANATPAGTVWVYKWGRDCDQMESSYIALHDASNVMQLEMSMFHWYDCAEGPCSWSVISPADAERYREDNNGPSYWRDHAAEQMGY